MQAALVYTSGDIEIEASSGQVNLADEDQASTETPQENPSDLTTETVLKQETNSREDTEDDEEMDEPQFGRINHHFKVGLYKYN